MYRRSTGCYSDVLLCLSNMSQMLLSAEKVEDTVNMCNSENSDQITLYLPSTTVNASSKRFGVVR